MLFELNQTRLNEIISDLIHYGDHLTEKFTSNLLKIQLQFQKGKLNFILLILSVLTVSIVIDKLYDFLRASFTSMIKKEMKRRQIYALSNVDRKIEVGQEKDAYTDNNTEQDDEMIAVFLHCSLIILMWILQLLKFAVFSTNSNLSCTELISTFVNLGIPLIIIWIIYYINIFERKLIERSIPFLDLNRPLIDFINRNSLKSISLKFIHRNKKYIKES